MTLLKFPTTNNYLKQNLQHLFFKSSLTPIEFLKATNLPRSDFYLIMDNQADRLSLKVRVEIAQALQIPFNKLFFTDLAVAL